MKNILITGSNKGIGYETARQLLLLGHHVIVSGRDAARLGLAVKELGKVGGSVRALLMDVGETGSIENAAAELTKDRVKLDVLVNNAAVLHKPDNNLVQDPESILSDTLNTNCMGPLRVAKAFLPLMDSPAHIINLSSGGGSMTDPVEGWSPAYCVSKSMLNALTRHLAYELESKRISVNAVCPGWVKTDMGGRSAPRSVERGAETIVWLATAEKSVTGKFFRDKKVIPW